MTETTTEFLTITRPDDFHLHLRDGIGLFSVLPQTVRQFARALIMPNLRSPVTTAKLMREYYERILTALPKGSDFKPLMTLYLTDNTTPDEIRHAKHSGIAVAVKMYPIGVTTNSNEGVTDWQKCLPAFETMQEVGLTLSIHGEVSDPDVDIFDREAVFIDKVLIPLRERMPELPIVLEHLTTKEGVDYILSAKGKIGATVTPHHLLYNRNALFKGGLHPHLFGAPILKKESDRQALLSAAASGNERFFAGTDSAPHARSTKESLNAAMGCYTALHALELYAQAFEQRNALDKLEAFTSLYGAQFYGLERNKGKVTLKRESWEIPEEVRFGNATTVPFAAGETLSWKVVDNPE